MKRRFVAAIAGAALAAGLVVALPSTTRAQEETLGNNLSVPAIFVPSMDGAPALRVACPTSAVPPGADGLTSDADGGTVTDYWEQSTLATWSAGCTAWGAAKATADWGDNLGHLNAHKPVRVEVGLLHLTKAMRGYEVVNLTPDLPDRDSTYGTDGTSFTTPVAAVGETPAVYTRIWDFKANLTIKRLVDGKWKVIYDKPMGAEVNSTGAVVFGHNWGSKGNPPAAGTYKLRFDVSNRTTIVGVMAEEATRPYFGDHYTGVKIKIG